MNNNENGSYINLHEITAQYPLPDLNKLYENDEDYNVVLVEAWNLLNKYLETAASIVRVVGLGFCFFSSTS
jgi:hypothetical protein